MKSTIEEIEEKQKHFDSIADDVWREIKKHIGLRSRKRRPTIVVMNRIKISRAYTKIDIVHMSYQDSTDGVLVHEFLHCAMRRAGMVKKMSNGKRLYHTRRMRVLEREICDKLGFKPTRWAEGLAASGYHRLRRLQIKSIIEKGCPIQLCKGELKKELAIPSFGTYLRCNKCGEGFWI